MRPASWIALVSIAIILLFGVLAIDWTGTETVEDGEPTDVTVEGEPIPGAEQSPPAATTGDTVLTEPAPTGPPPTEQTGD